MAKRKKNISNTADNVNASTYKYPAVSVIIPMYNAEKYIGDCLNSLIAQTFTDFEVIVVDDCSTDSSPAIVQSYAEKFGGRLTFTRLQKNSGNAGYTARNCGFSFSRGEYIFFMDSDDFLTKTALEELYTAAKEFDADVVYTGSRYRYTTKGGVIFTTDRIGRELKAKNLPDKPTLTVNDPHKNLTELLIKTKLYWTPWTKFVRRNFLTEHGITFYEILSGGDYIWTIELFTTAERFLRIPNAVYLWRDDSMNSMTRNKRPLNKQIATWNEACIYIAEAIGDLLKKYQILRENPVYSHSALSLHFGFCLNKNFQARMQVQSAAVYEILRREFADKGDIDLIIPFMFSVIDSQQKALIQTQQQFQKFAAQAQKRIADLESEIRHLKQTE